MWKRREDKTVNEASDSVLLDYSFHSLLILAHFCPVRSSSFSVPYVTWTSKNCFYFYVDTCMERKSWPHVLLLLCILNLKPVNCLQGLGGGFLILNFNTSNSISTTAALSTFPDQQHSNLIIRNAHAWSKDDFPPLSKILS